MKPKNDSKPLANLKTAEYSEQDPEIQSRETIDIDSLNSGMIEEIIREIRMEEEDKD